MNSAQSTPLVSVIALCFNHARFVVECLESIRAQTFQDFDLVIMDDCSSDDSVAIITDWIARTGTQCTFVAHKVNAGVCQTQNEAIALGRGEFLCVIAADDRWRPDRIESHLKAFAALPPDVALVYSDTAQIDEHGNALPETFLEGQRPGFKLPSGRVFEELINRNFVHPVSSTMRRDAVSKVGGYDTRLTIEDYDMWLRLANEYQFAYVEGIYSDYRIVSTSLTRTLWVAPSARFVYGQFLLREKWIPSGLLNARQRKIWSDHQSEFAYWLYFHGDPRATRCLWTAALRTKRPRFFALATLSALGVRRQRAKRVATALGLVRDN
ncbi:glycosyltransferase [Hydrogenophaga sp.]|uniref:glycosyltransferase n=1 Tax=Hydrogenophaga sp. TaxID=1904254 RepID=UPI002FC9F020